MTIQPITLNLPGHLYNRLKRRAEQAHRTVEAELLEVVASAVPVADELPLVRQYERVMLVRAHAAALLKQRGHDVSELPCNPSSNTLLP